MTTQEVIDKINDVINRHAALWDAVEAGIWSREIREILDSLGSFELVELFEKLLGRGVKVK